MASRQVLGKFSQSEGKQQTVGGADALRAGCFVGSSPSKRTRGRRPPGTRPWRCSRIELSPGPVSVSPPTRRRVNAGRRSRSGSAASSSSSTPFRRSSRPTYSTCSPAVLPPRIGRSKSGSSGCGEISALGKDCRSRTRASIAVVGESTRSAQEIALDSRWSMQARSNERRGSPSSARTSTEGVWSRTARVVPASSPRVRLAWRQKYPSPSYSGNSMTSKGASALSRRIFWKT